MKSVYQVAKENKKVTVVSVISAIIAIGSMLIEQAEVFGINTETISWAGGVIAVLTFVSTYLSENFTIKK